MATGHELEMDALKTLVTISKEMNLVPAYSELAVRKLRAAVGGKDDTSGIADTRTLIGKVEALGKLAKEVIDLTIATSNTIDK